MDYSLTQLFKTLIDQNGSDLHISAGTPPRLRINGQILPLNLPPLSPQNSEELIYSILSESQKKEVEQNRETDLSFSVQGLARFRANVYFESGSLAASFRLIPENMLSLSTFNSSRTLEGLCSLSRGLILVTGPTGSGKSTTLAAMINHINETQYSRIVTIEDPIEFIHNHKNSMVNQREVGTDTFSFAKAMKSVLRQDPDVIMIGELRDLETISSALTLAETGHLVFASLHTNTAISSVNRVIDAFPSSQQAQIRTQLSMTLESVISQRLIVNNQGNRSLAMEILIATPPVRALISESKINQLYSSMQSGQADSGMQTMNQSLVSLYQSRQISKEAAIQASINRDEILNLMISQSTTNRSRRR